MGSAAIDLAYTAVGRFDGFFELNLSVWDVAAGAYIVKQAGGRVLDFSGNEKLTDGIQIIAGNSTIADELKKTLNRHGLS